MNYYFSHNILRLLHQHNRGLNLPTRRFDVWPDLMHFHYKFIKSLAQTGCELKYCYGEHSPTTNSSVPSLYTKPMLGEKQPKFG